jgi:hypothetical protein
MRRLRQMQSWRPSGEDEAAILPCHPGRQLELRQRGSADRSQQRIGAGLRVCVHGAIGIQYGLQAPERERPRRRWSGEAFDGDLDLPHGARHGIAG